MSGACRKSYHRKGVTQSYANVEIKPNKENNEEICRVRYSRGTNIFEIELENGKVELACLPNKFKKLIWIKRKDYLIVSNSVTNTIIEEIKTPNNNSNNISNNSSNDNNEIDVENNLEHITTVFNIESDEILTPIIVNNDSNKSIIDINKSQEEHAVKYAIVHILNKDHIKYIKSEGLWPSSFLDEKDERKLSSSKDYGGFDSMPDYNISTNDDAYSNNINDDAYDEGEYEDGDEVEEELVDKMGNTIIRTK